MSLVGGRLNCGAINDEIGMGDFDDQYQQLASCVRKGSSRTGNQTRIH
jgi:hypothetical protein